MEASLKQNCNIKLGDEEKNGLTKQLQTQRKFYSSSALTIFYTNRMEQKLASENSGGNQSFCDNEAIAFLSEGDEKNINFIKIVFNKIRFHKKFRSSTD
ncbi:hypothetical protein MHBO_002956 [Bonamia ostreae]|uniref:Uncharacterized protein n=1 Tax=Bonamia ostreae TaxID=126728 RepID=A0ABV2AP29_9EUKA